MEFLTDGDVLILTDSSTLKYVINEMPVSIHLFSVFSNLFKIRSDLTDPSSKVEALDLSVFRPSL